MMHGKICPNYMQAKGIDPNSKEGRDLEEATMKILHAYEVMRKKILEGRSKLPESFSDLDPSDRYDMALKRIWERKNERLKEQGQPPIYS